MDPLDLYVRAESKEEWRKLLASLGHQSQVDRTPFLVYVTTPRYYIRIQAPHAPDVKLSNTPLPANKRKVPFPLSWIIWTTVAFVLGWATGLLTILRH